MNTEQDVLNSLQDDIWSSLAVDAVIAEKVEKRAQRGQDLQMYSLEIQPRFREERFNMENVNTFVDAIHQQAMNSSKPIRVQLVVKTSNVHWTAMDIEVSQEGVKCINIDAVADPTSLGAKEIFDKLVEKYPNSDPNKSKFYFLRDGSLPSDETKKQGIQYDGASCSRFALDILFHLSNLDSFTILENREQEMRENNTPFKIPSGSKHERFFNASNIPPEFAFVYRGTQSKESFASLPETLYQQEVNKKGENLASAEAKHTKPVEVKGVTKLRNLAIQHKRDGFIQDVREAMLSQPGFLKKVQDRDALTAIAKGSLAAQRKFIQPSVTANLIREAQSIMENKTPNGLSGKYNRLCDRYHFFQSARDLEKGKIPEAIGHLSAVSCLTENHKNRLTTIQKEFQEDDEKVLGDEQPKLMG
ncbi:hypothetical protein BN59_02058 [Legionella massiliensis]|uniref:Dot/Icm T4SS effector n=1 Tax=Legionella massiliensis TaxID=1034943 RepID=A0A078L125_9GAMM|nr:hypothetical protein [Legionella massiliensis]CDZ77768.1 hypothetical protein BN59_02058 [Legionella massiliensis]CEE13506.1 hypothetical protein BN1094_02058 [Legionella massiliensis]